MTALALGVLGASLLGSVHCAGMCGGLVAVYAGGAARGREAWTAHAAYNGGRLLAYTTLGGLAGLAGAALDLAGAAAGLQRVAAAVAGTLIIVWGLATLLESRGIRVPVPRASRFVRGIAGRMLGRVASTRAPTRGLVMGLLTGLLPCGWLWAFVVTAAGTGSGLDGVVTMTAFWVGTLPVMTTVGMGVAAMTGPLRRHLGAVTGVLLITVGLLAVTGRLRAPEPGHSHHGDTGHGAPSIERMAPDAPSRESHDHR